MFVKVVFTVASAVVAGALPPHATVFVPERWYASSLLSVPSLSSPVTGLRADDLLVRGARVVLQFV